MKTQLTNYCKILKLRWMGTTTYQVWKGKELLGHFNSLNEAVNYALRIPNASSEADNISTGLLAAAAALDVTVEQIVTYE